MKKNYDFFKILVVALFAIIAVSSCSDDEAEPAKSMIIDGKEIKLDGGCLLRWLAPSDPKYIKGDTIYTTLSMCEINMYSFGVKENVKAINDTLFEGEAYEDGLKDTMIVYQNDTSTNADNDTLRYKVPIIKTNSYFAGIGDMIRLTVIAHNTTISKGVYTYDADATVETGFYGNTIIDSCELILNKNYEDTVQGLVSYINGGTITVVDVNAEKSYIELEFNLTTNKGQKIKGQYGGSAKMINEYDKAIKRGLVK